MIICCWLTLVLLTIVCICFHKLYLSAPKVGGEIMKKYCPKCGKEMYNDFCSNCGYTFVKMGDLSVVHSYEPSSATALTTPYSILVDKFGDPEERKRKNELVDNKLSEQILDSFLRWGYLEYTGGKYGFTDDGKEAYYKNLEFWGEKTKKREKPRKKKES